MTMTSERESNLLNQPLQLPNGAVLRNRLAKSSMSEALGTYDNHPTQQLLTLYQRWAQSGIGLLFSGNVMIDRRALGEPGNVVIEDESDLPSLKQWAEAATNEGVMDAVGIARLMAIDPDAPAALLSGRDSNQEVRPISTGIKPIDRMGLMEILWYTRQLKRIAQGKNPNPNESGLWAFLSSVVNSGWGTYRTKRLRA